MGPSPSPRPRAAKNEPTAAPKAFGRFELLDRIGVGGMAEVFRAEVRGPEGFKRELVVKRVLPHLSSRARFTQMFVNEAKISALLNHPNIVQIFEFGESDGSYFIAMESVRGHTLREALTKLRVRDALMPVVAAMEIAREILAALDYAHNLRDPAGRDLGIVHRDISPSNVMLADNGAVKVLDFGIARAADLMEEDDNKVVKGKIAYLAPEQIALAEVDARVDLFALGCVLSEMLTGRLLFRAQNDIQKKLALLAEPSRPPSAHNPEVPPAVDAIVLKAVARSLWDRYESAADMLIDVENYLSSFRSANRSVLRLVRSLDDGADAAEPSHPSASTPDSEQRAGGGAPSGPAAAGEPARGGGVGGGGGRSRSGSGRPSSASRTSSSSSAVSRPPTAISRPPTAASHRTSSYGAAQVPARHGATDAARDPEGARRGSDRPPITTSQIGSGRLAGAAHAEGARVDRRNHRRRWANVGAGILTGAAVLAVILGARALLGHFAIAERLTRAVASKHPAPPTAAAPAPFVLITFVTRPAGAQIHDALSGRSLGVSPATLPVTQASGRARFRFERDGFLPATLDLTPDADRTVNVTLRPAPSGGIRGAARRKAAAQ